MLVFVGGTDITEFVNEKTYALNEEKTFESWKDGNFREHRIYTSKKVKGTFEVALYGASNMDLQAFLDLWNSEVNNEIITLGVHVNNTNEFRVINAYYAIVGNSHREIANGGFLDVLTIEISER
jgi:hypothetical protein